MSKDNSSAPIDPYAPEGYAADGFDQWGYDREGYDREGYNEDGNDREGYDRTAPPMWARHEIIATALDDDVRRDRDKLVYDAEGYDQYGYSREGYNREGYNSEGYQKPGHSLDNGVPYDEDADDFPDGAPASYFAPHYNHVDWVDD